jgi:hypothetical protein
MPNPATVRQRRLRKTKAQLIDEIDTLEQRAAAIETANRSSAPMRAKASDRDLANRELAHLARRWNDGRHAGRAHAEPERGYCKTTCDCHQLLR